MDAKQQSLLDHLEAVRELHKEFLRAGSDVAERLEKGLVLVAESYIFELERRGYIKAGPFLSPKLLL